VNHQRRHQGLGAGLDAVRGARGRAERGVHRARRRRILRDELLGGPVETPNIDRIAAAGVRSPSGTPRRCARRPALACWPGATTPATRWRASPRPRSGSRTRV